MRLTGAVAGSAGLRLGVRPCAGQARGAQSDSYVAKARKDSAALRAALSACARDGRYRSNSVPNGVITVDVSAAARVSNGTGSTVSLCGVSSSGWAKAVTASSTSNTGYL